jgi:hypothetical protein
MHSFGRSSGYLAIFGPGEVTQLIDSYFEKHFMQKSELQFD